MHLIEKTQNVTKLHVRAQGRQIIFRFVNRELGDVIEHPSNAKRVFFISLLGFVMITKCVASSGMMVFAEKDLLENQHYIFWKVFFRYIPPFTTNSIVACTVFSDTFMNLMTRGSATAKMLRHLLGHPKAKSLALVDDKRLRDSCGMRQAKALVIFCGGLSSVTASMVAFLGAVTLGHYVTNDIAILMIWGGLVALANFIANISYRIDKSVENFASFIRGELKFSLASCLISLIGSAAFLGTCYYGTANAIRKLLSLLKIYAGNPDSGLGLVTRYEEAINWATDATLPFAVISYFFSSCVPMFPTKNALAGWTDQEVCIPMNQVVRYVNLMKKTERYTRRQRSLYLDPDFWYFEALQLFCITLMPFFVLSAVLGNLLPTFNSSNGLIIHVFFNDVVDFSYAQKIVVALLSAVLTLVFSKIFWAFNIIDWFNQVEALWVKEAMRVLEHTGVFRPQEGLEALQEAINTANSPSIDANQGSWWRFFSSASVSQAPQLGLGGHLDQADHEDYFLLPDGPSSSKMA